MESKKRFLAVTLVLYLSSLISYYTQIKIIDLYGLNVKYYFDLYLSYLQITITLVIFGLPNAISIMVSRENKIPRHIRRYSLLFAFLSSTMLNFIFLDGDLKIQIVILIFMYVSLFNDLNTGLMSSIGMFEYPRFFQLIGNILLLIFVFFAPLTFLNSLDLSNEWYALMFLVIPVLPLFLALNFGSKFKRKLKGFESVSLISVSKYLSYIYLFSILSIIVTRAPYINFSEFISKHDLAQYTLSVSLSNFMVIPLSLFTLKVLSSNVGNSINIKLVNLFLLFFISASSLVLFYVSGTFDLLHSLTNISSPEILMSTYLVVGFTAIASINLSISLRMQKRLKHFFVIDLILVIFLYIITLGVFYSFEDLSGYNYAIVLAIFSKILCQVYFLRD